jgi:hypothetical protein
MRGRDRAPGSWSSSARASRSSCTSRRRGHDVLPFSVAQEYPPDKKIVPGEVFATTLAELVDHELGGLSGWRPNDFVLWGPGLWADNNANRQLGIVTGRARVDARLQRSPDEGVRRPSTIRTSSPPTTRSGTT